MAVMKLQERIESKLRAQLSPRHLEVVNESSRHSVPPGSETHFKVTVVAPEFDGQTLVERHRRVYHVLFDEMREGVHALALHTHSPNEWEQGAHVAASPPCAK